MAGNDRLYPGLTNGSYLVLARRRELLKIEAAKLNAQGKRDLVLVDVGGHESPYKPLFAPLTKMHLSLDLGHRDANVHGVGEAMPFAPGSVDIVLCTQVIEHVVLPQAIVDEIYRVLKPGGLVFLSAPAVYPSHGGPYDNWRFMSGGLRVLLRAFADVRVMAEGGTWAGFFGTMNLYLLTFCGRAWGRPLAWLLSHSVIPFFNLIGWYGDSLLHAGDTFAVNWLAVAVK